MATESELSVGCISDKEEYSSLQNDYQEINLTGDDENNMHIVNAKNVIIYTPPYNRGSSSSRVKINNIVNYAWEMKYQLGHLVASTLKGDYFAYSILLTQRVIGAVRVVKHKTDRKVLIKDLKGQVKDVAFAYTEEVILACIDEFGNLEVHEIEDDGVQLRNKILLKLDRDNDVGSPSSYHLLFWCPFIPDDPNNILVNKNEESNSTLLALTHNKEVEVINVSHLSRQYGGTPILSRQLPSSSKILIKNPREVTVATFSPDGTALATGSLEGDVNFYEMKESAFEKDEMPSCIHEWKPHCGKPISTLFFLDNHKYHQPEVQFWKFALTGAESNQEIKLWSCETWACLQTLRFTTPMELKPFQLKAELDATGGYLLLSDLFNKSVYVLQIYQNNHDCVVNVCSIAEFPMTYPILSIAPIEAIKCRIKITDEVEPSKRNDNDQNGEEDDEEESNKDLSIKGISIRCFWISTKSLQECQITYHPQIILPFQGDDTISLHSQDSLAFRSCLSVIDLQDSLIQSENESDIKLPNRVQSLTDREDLLLTPNDFESPSHGKPTIGHSPALTKFPNSNTSLTPSSVPLPPVSPTEELNLNTSVSSISSISNSNSTLTKRLSQSFGKEGLSVKSEDLLADDDEPLATSETVIQRKLSQRSSGSSPSQEVADIMEPVKTMISDLVNIPSQTNGDVTVMEDSPDLDDKSEQDVNISVKGSHGDFSSWPQAPDISKELKFIQAADKPSFTNQSLLASETSLVNTRAYEDIEPKLTKIEHALQSLTEEIRSLSNIRQQQCLEIQSLQQQLNKYQDQTRYFQSLNHRLDNLEGSISTRIQKAFADHSQYEKVENLFSRREEFDRGWMEKQLSEASNIASTTVANRFDKTIKNEMKMMVLPNMSKSLDVFKETLHNDMLQRLSLTEISLKDNMSKILKNKVFIESVGQNVSMNLQPQIQATCRDLLLGQLVPTFEKICQNLFMELNDAFKIGTREYLQQAERFIEKNNQQTSSAITQQMQDHISHFNKSKDLLLQSVHKELSNSISTLSETMLHRLRPIVAEEVKTALNEHSQTVTQVVATDERGLISRTMTPIPNVVDIHVKQQLILQHLRNGQYNSAFQEALNAIDVDLVVFVCENVTPNKVFGQVPCPLKQPVLLSLVQQLGRNLNDKIDVKISYLEEALMTLDPTDAVTRTHLPTVIAQLRSRLSSFIQFNPTTNHLSKIKMILMATNALSVGS